MIYKLFLIIFGYSVFTIKENAVEAVNYIISKSLNCTGIRICDGILTFKASLLSRRRVKRSLARAGFHDTVIEDHGLPGLLLRYKNRWGLYVGAVIFAAVIYFSSNLVWQINVIGNDTIDDETIIGNLSGIGFGVGSYIPTANVKLICNEYMLKHNDVAWMSINIIGTCADIRIRESLTSGDEGVRSSLPSSIVAARDGFIERIELGNGQILINSGSTVRKGETIVSGAVESPDGTFRLVRSEAKVYAKTIHEFSVTVPFEQIEKERYAEDKKSYSLIFFSNMFDLINRSELYEDSEPEKSISYLTLPGGITLPVGMAVTTFYSYSESGSVINADKAGQIARKELAELISRELPDADILSVSRETEQTESEFRVTAHVYCIEDIARELPIAESQTSEHKN